MRTKIIFALLAVFLFPAIQATAQATFEDPPREKLENQAKNLVKVNLFSIPLKNASLQYERAVGKKTTVALGVRFMPMGSLPLKQTIKNIASDESENNDEINKQLDNFKIGNVAFTPEFRLYTGKEAFRGFYIAPYARYANFSVDLPFELDTEDENNNPTTETIPLNGNLSTIAGGIMIGAQWKLSKQIYLDWWILGPQYGVATGTLTAKKSLTQQEQTDLREQLDEFADDIPIIKIKSDINNNGAKVTVDGPWAGIRAGLCIGIRF